MNLRRWKRNDFTEKDFEFITGCSYFNYQGDHVYIRTSRIHRRRKARLHHGRRNSALRPNRDCFVAEPRCPSCSGSDVEIPIGVNRWSQPRVKRVFELAVSASGIRRQVIKTRSAIHRCRGCGQQFVPRAHRQLDNHFHNLKSFAIYLYVAYNFSTERIRELIHELFGLTVFSQDIVSFRNLLAGMYQATADQTLARLAAGSLINVDETEVKLKTGKGYVWVFANAEEVFYMYRPNREGGFLLDLLKDFHGVLVSDFYSAYDGLPCVQQKCLIHLMRDMNQDLLNNPFDEDLKAITRPFGALIRSIVSTVTSMA